MNNMFTSLSAFLLNLKENLYHKISLEEIELIKNSFLFERLDEEQFFNLLKSIQIIRFVKNKLIFSKGEQADAIYIIKKGSVRVFNYDTQGEKVPLARLNRGDYFGEQGVLEEGSKTRAANVETIVPTILIKIPAKYYKFPSSPHTVELAKKSVYLPVDFYSFLETFIHEFKNAKVMELKDSSIIFKEGDLSNEVYFILSGEVRLVFPHLKDLILRKGHLFGELAILSNKPRSATALAQGQVKLLKIKGEEFKNVIPENPKLNQFLSSLQQVYQLPKQGSMEQYIGLIQDLGPVITSVYRMEDKRVVVGSRLLNESLFMMSTVNISGQKIYRYAKNDTKIDLEILDNHLVGINLLGTWEDLPQACELVINRYSIDPAILQQFESTGELKVKKRGEDEIICSCLHLTKQELEGYINKGFKDLSSLSQETGVCTLCRGCEHRVLQLLKESYWISALMKKSKDHSKNVSSYVIYPLIGQFKDFKPGQHVIVQVKIKENWIERPYTISGKEGDGLRITIKLDQESILTRWLKEEAPMEFPVNSTHPLGDFYLNTQSKSVLCLAGGIGITPFISFAQYVTDKNLKIKLHIFYCALTKKDFIFTDEFEELTTKNSFFNIKYKPTNLEGIITTQEIYDAISQLLEPDIYICGPSGFTNLILNALQKINYDDKKIFCERFFHARIEEENPQ